MEQGRRRFPLPRKMHCTSYLLFVFMIEWEAISTTPVTTCMVDLTHAYNEDIPFWPGSRKFDINQTTVDKPDGKPPKLTTEEFASPTHMGTHFDAPCHIVGNHKKVTDFPLEKLINVPAAVVDVTRKAKNDPNYVVKINDLTKWEKANGRPLNNVVLLIHSGWSERWPDQKSYAGNSDNDVQNLHFPGISGEASRWLVEHRNVVGIGIDTLSIDCGQCKDLPTHKIWLSNGSFGLENLKNLGKLPACGATVYIMPMKISDACGAPCRVVAAFPGTKCT